MIQPRPMPAKLAADICGEPAGFALTNLSNARLSARPYLAILPSMGAGMSRQINQPIAAAERPPVARTRPQGMPSNWGA